MTISTRTFDYRDGDTRCTGYLAYDESVARARPGILINHAWGGRDDFAEGVAVQMAANGYVGVALDNYGGAARPETVDDKMSLMGPLKEDRAALRQRLKAGYDAAAALDEVDSGAMAAMGFCFGGLCTLDMARAGLDLKAAISYHGLLDAPDLPRSDIRADVLVCHGYDDPMADPDSLRAVQDELSTSGCDWTVMSFGNTKHAFMVPEADDAELGLKYNKSAADQSWAATFDLLRKHFGMHGTDAA
ncbi:dienelactone hydrolase family protein [uncultured Algimonas sp.]|uniref:dienelactone hydrolase family protein n=1 Tax=uncultured Algimonas sp. TaxID=1547920 RepID=UPI002612A2FA|nr:dienelactone hydrolase family protein [uncultured Algimonas sp.]